MTESPFSTQGWNRYSYVGNSPLNFTDPSGYCFMGCFWKSAFRAIGNFFRQNWGSLVQIAAAAICSAVGGPGLGSACGAIASAIVTGITSGDLGKALRAGLISAVTAIAFYGVGELTGSLGLEGVLDPDLGGHGPLGFMSEAHLFNVAGHAAVGCGSAVASGGKCGPGALSAGAGSFVGPMVENAGFYGGLVITSTVGGLASVAGGGKFGNGAVTAAFGYLFNQMAKRVGRGGNGRPLYPNDNRPPPGGMEAITMALAAIVGLTEVVTTNLLAPIKTHDHHIFPGEFEPYFSARKIDIDDYTITLGEKTHLKGVHGKGLNGMPGKWNTEWQEFIDLHPYATRSEVFRQAGRMLDTYKLNDYPIHRYKVK